MPPITTTTSSITITPAQHRDLPTLIQIQWDAMEPNVLRPFLHPRRRDLAIQKHNEAMSHILGRRFTHPTNRCHVHKAVDEATGQIVAWSLVRWEDGRIDVPAEPSGAAGVGAEDFKACYVRGVMRAWREVCGGREHVVLGALYVAPAFQGQGVGTRLVQHLYRLYELEKEPVVVQTRASSEAFYVKLGWKTVASADLDLSLWRGEGQGYGVHRSPQMLRDPGGVLEERKAGGGIR